MPPCLLSLISIPPITKSLVHQLPWESLQVLILVNHAFHDHLTPHMYRRPLFLSLSRSLSHEGMVSGIERYGGYVVDIEVEKSHKYPGTEQIAKVLDQHCRHLRKLHMGINSLSTSSNFFSLVQHNACSLTHLDIQVYIQAPVPPDHYTLWLQALLEGCRHLTVLHIDTYNPRVQPYTLDTILAIGRYCPALMDLKIADWICQRSFKEEDSSFTKVEENTERDTHAVATHPSSADNFLVAFPCLESLHVCGTDEDVLVRLVQHCSRLTSLAFWGVFDPSLISPLTQALGRAAKHLKSIYIDKSLPYINARKFSEDDLETMIVNLGRHCPEVNSISLKGFLRSKNLMCMIVGLYGPQLTSLKVTHTWEISSEGVFAVMTQCPHLRTAWFRLNQNVQRGYFMFAMDPRIIFREPWVCSATLETFVCPLGFVSGAEPEDMQMGAPDHRAIELQVCTQLGRLHRLRYLSIGVGNYRDGLSGTMRMHTFSWALDRGLNQLSSLRRLSNVDLGWARNNISVDELGWMKQHWPMLLYFRAKDSERILQTWIENNMTDVHFRGIY